MAIALRYAARSDVGLVRQENQDSGYAGPHLLVVADGMGGHAAGDVASSIAIGEMVSLDGESPGADEALDLLAEALRTANSELREAMRRQPELQGMGTTVTACCGPATRSPSRTSATPAPTSCAMARSPRSRTTTRLFRAWSTKVGLPRRRLKVTHSVHW